MKRGEKTPEAEKRRRQRQRKYKRYMELRDELQTLGVIPVEPSGARKSEAVDPATQGEQAIPNLVAQAIRNGWAVPEHKKPDIVDEMLAVIDNPEESNKVKVAAFNALRMADKDQYERDHPDEGSKTPPSQININIETVEKREDIPLVEVSVIGGASGTEDRPRLPEAAAVPPE